MAGKNPKGKKTNHQKTAGQTIQPVGNVKSIGKSDNDKSGKRNIPKTQTDNAEKRNIEKVNPQVFIKQKRHR